MNSVQTRSSQTFRQKQIPSSKDLEVHVDIPAEIDGMPVTAITGEGDPKKDPNDAAFAFSQIKSV